MLAQGSFDLNTVYFILWSPDINTVNFILWIPKRCTDIFLGLGTKDSIKPKLLSVLSIFTFIIFLYFKGLLVKISLKVCISVHEDFFLNKQCRP